MLEVEWFCYVVPHPRLMLCKRVQMTCSEEGTAPESYGAGDLIGTKDTWLDPNLVQNQMFTAIDLRPLDLPFSTAPAESNDDEPLREEPLGLYHLLFTRCTAKQKLPMKPEGADQEWHIRAVNRMYERGTYVPSVRTPL